MLEKKLKERYQDFGTPINDFEKKTLQNRQQFEDG